MLLVYNILVGFAFVFVMPYFIWRYKLAAFDKMALGIKQRLGFYDIEKGKDILIHASSVGELKTITMFIEKLKKMFPGKKILILTMTPYGYKYVLDKKIADKVVFAPIDVPFCVEKLFLRVIPEMLILVESELWPNLIFSVARKGAKIVSINARMSDKSFRRYLFVKEFMAEILKNIDFICAREESDRNKFIALGYDEKKVIKTGNMKYDKIETVSTKRSITNKDFGFTDTDLIFVAGSTREQEEEIVINVYKKLAEEFSNLKLTIAPRYPERCQDVEKILQKENISFIRKSQLPTPHSLLPASRCLLLDTIGELTDAYSIGTITFVGGSLFDGAGGHNMLEPAELGKTVIFGKFVKNFQESAELLILQKAAFQVSDEKEFCNSARRLLIDAKLRDEMGKRAKEVVVSRRGATDKSLKIISEIIKDDANR
ncbi:MAG: 3-deoxy-D-manno-octulosonic acid transferase [Elusimicrobia bacterium]|nr:3-deoxy-D-manno-octulosonic acid transferase [Elusimicrobiota bacterium]